MDSALRSSYGKWAAVLSYAGLIYFVSSRPEVPAILSGTGLSDYEAHIIEYAGFNILLIHALTGQRSKRSAAVIAMLLVAFYAISDELHQINVPLRDCSIGDLLADGIGATAGLVLFQIPAWWSEKSRSLLSLARTTLPARLQ